MKSVTDILPIAMNAGFHVLDCQFCFLSFATCASKGCICYNKIFKDGIQVLLSLNKNDHTEEYDKFITKYFLLHANITAKLGCSNVNILRGILLDSK